MITGREFSSNKELNCDSFEKRGSSNSAVVCKSKLEEFGIYTNPKHDMRCTLAPRLTKISSFPMASMLRCCSWASFWVASLFRSSLSTVLWDSSSTRRQAAKNFFLGNQATVLSRKIGYFFALWLFGMANHVFLTSTAVCLRIA